jgi:hypothetical protein
MLPLTHMLLGALLQVAPLDPTPPAPRLELNVFEADLSRPRRCATSSGAAEVQSDPVLRSLPKGETPQPWINTPMERRPRSSALAETGVFVVEPGERYIYAYVGKDIQPIEGEVTIGMHDAFTVRDLIVEPSVRTQMLRVHLSRPNGMPIRHDMQVSVESLVTGLTLFQSAIPANESRYGMFCRSPLPRARRERRERAGHVR